MISCCCDISGTGMSYCRMLLLLLLAVAQVCGKLAEDDQPYGKLWHPVDCERDMYLHHGTCDMARWQEKNSNCQVCRNLAAAFVGAKLTTNSPEYDDFACLEDLIFDEDQQRYCMKALKEATESDEPGRKRRSIRRHDKFPASKWPNTIYYKIDGNLTKAEARKIKTAIHMWANNTCLNFEEVDVDQHVPEQHLLFARTPHLGCYSYIGRTQTDIPQTIYLSYSCFSTPGYIAHEIGHALGLFHEHQRDDRDEYITVEKRNIRYGAEGNFAIMSSDVMDHMGVEYDPGSSMHYRAKAFSLFGGDTIRTKDPLYQRVIGQRVELSFTDIKTINKAYCPDTCNSVTLARSCQHGGYQNPTLCESCACPDGWGGTYCEHVATPVNADSGGSFRAYTTPRTITSPGYLCGYYMPYQQSSWLITAPPNQKVTAQFSGGFGLYCYSNRCQHWVETRLTDLTRTGPRFCCYKLPREKLVSQGNQMLVIFKSNTPSAESTRRGFQLQYFVDRPWNPCQTRPCQHYGMCLPDGATYVCRCIHGYSGRNCERNRPDVVDLVFMLDKSPHSQKDWTQIKNFVKNLIRRTDVGPEKSHIGVIDFDNTARMLFPLNQYMTNRAMEAPLDSLQMTFRQANLITPLWLMQNRMQEVSQGDRLNAPNLAVLVTDSPLPPDDSSRRIIFTAAEQLRSTGTAILAIGVGPLAHAEDLGRIAGFPERVITVPDYSQLSGDMDLIYRTLGKIALIVTEEEDKMYMSTTTTTTTPNPTTTSTQQPTTTTSTTTTSATTTTTTPTTTTTTTPTTTTTTPAPTTTPKWRPKCRWEITGCSQQCGGCGRNYYTRRCEQRDGTWQVAYSFNVPCNAKPCPIVCRVYVGKRYNMDCPRCCAGYEEKGGVCVYWRNVR